jgi:hypothetical protein
LKTPESQKLLVDVVGVRLSLGALLFLGISGDPREHSVFPFPFKVFWGNGRTELGSW